MTAGPGLDTLPTAALTRLLADGPTDADRCAAAAALGRRCGDEATAALVERLRHRLSLTVSEACADALAVIGAPAVPALSRLAADRGAGAYAARALHQIGGPEAEEGLAAYEVEKTVIKVEAGIDGARDKPWTPRWVSRSIFALALVGLVLLLMTGNEGGLAFWAVIVAAVVVLALESLVCRRHKERWWLRVRHHAAGATDSDTDPEIASFVDVALDGERLKEGSGDSREPSSLR
jgi:hypothetical protein